MIGPDPGLIRPGPAAASAGGPAPTRPRKETTMRHAEPVADEPPLVRLRRPVEPFPSPASRARSRWTCTPAPRPARRRPPGPARGAATSSASAAAARGGSSGSPAASCRPRSRSSAVTARRHSCCAGPARRLRRPQPPRPAGRPGRGTPAGPGRPPGRPAAGRERAHLLRHPRRRRGQRPRALRRALPGRRRPLRASPGPLDVHRPGVRLTDCRRIRPWHAGAMTPRTASSPGGTTR